MNLGKATGIIAPAGVVSLGLGEYVVGHQAEGTWVIYGLGSCIGLILSDHVGRNAAMAHIVLPQSPGSGEVSQPGKYVDTAVPFLLDELRKLGSDVRNVRAQMVGGAKMLQLKKMGDIGSRNIESIRQVLAEHRIPIIAERLGGTSGRTLRWDRKLGIATMSQVGQPDIVLTPVAYRFAAG